MSVSLTQLEQSDNETAVAGNERSQMPVFPDIWDLCN